MTDITYLQFEDFDFRITDKEGNPWFVLRDVAKAANVKNSKDISARLDDDEKAEVDIIDLRSGQRRKMTIISEPALMLFIMRSNAALVKGTRAYRLRRWVTHEVLPSIRKHGVYPPPAIAPEPEPEFIPATVGGRLLQKIKEFETIKGTSIHTAAGILHRNKLEEIESGRLDARAVISRQAMSLKLVSLGFDLRYLLHGEYQKGFTHFLPAIDHDEVKRLH